MKTTAETNKTTTLAIDGMTCEHCVQAVTKSLSAVPGVTVKSVAVGSAVIETVDGGATGKAVAALEEAGYPAREVDGTAPTSARIASTSKAGPATSGGGCCSGAKAMTADDAPETKTPGGCCG